MGRVKQPRRTRIGRPAQLHLSQRRRVEQHQPPEHRLHFDLYSDDVRDRLADARILLGRQFAPADLLLRDVVRQRAAGCAAPRGLGALSATASPYIYHPARARTDCRGRYSAGLPVSVCCYRRRPAAPCRRRLRDLCREWIRRLATLEYLLLPEFHRVGVRVGQPVLENCGAVHPSRHRVQRCRPLQVLARLAHGQHLHGLLSAVRLSRKPLHHGAVRQLHGGASLLLT